MSLRAILGVLALVIACATVWADELKINPNHPDQYTVVKGDTLWDISGKFLNHPWQWPQLWRHNPQVKDPHWIYPGDTLYFSYVNGVPQLSLSADSREQKLVPRVREGAIEQAIPMISNDVVMPFLTSPKVVGADDLQQSPYVIGFVGEHLIAGAGDGVYVRAIEQPKGLNYTIYRQGNPYVSPETGEVLGYEARFVADAVLQVSGDPATLTINKADVEIQRGDRLMLSADEPAALNYYPRSPEKPVLGRIIRVMGGVSQIGQHDVVVIDKGSADGIEVGHALEVFRKGQVLIDRYQSKEALSVKMPEERAGVLMVFRSFERVSYALVMEASAAIHTLDIVRTP